MVCAVLKNSRADKSTVANLFLWAGLCASLAYLPKAMFPDIGEYFHLNTIARVTIPLAPFVLALFLLPAKTPQKDILARLNYGVMIVFVTSTVVSVVLRSHPMLMTILGGTTGMAISYFGGVRLASYCDERVADRFLAGIQVGFLMFGLYMILSGNISLARIGAGVIDQQFFDTENIGRNVMTLVGLTALAATFAGIGRRATTRERLALDLSVCVLALYFVYIVPGKGAWAGAGFLVVAFVGVLLRRGDWRWLVAIAIALVFAVPIMYERIFQYLYIYEQHGSAFTLSGRIFLWQAAFKAVAAGKAYLLGFGYDSAVEVSSKVLGGLPLLHFHNEFVNAYYDGGIVGVAAITGALFAAYWFAFKQSFLVPARRQSVASLFAGFFLVLLTSRLMTDVTLTTMGQSVLLWFFCCGMLSARAAQPSKEASRQRKSTRRLPSGASAPAV